MNHHHCEPSGNNTRTLYALDLPARLCDTGSAELRRGLYVDCETTGFSFDRDQVIEVAMLPFTYAVDDGRIAEVLHHEAQVYLQDPGRPLDAEITSLTGLTDDDLRGRHIDTAAANALIERSDLIIAHNARFDRPFFERALPATHDKPWACSMRDVPWTAHGCPSAALHCTASPAATGCLHVTATAPSPTARSACGCSHKPSPTPIGACWRRCARARQRTPSGCGRFTPQSTPRTRSAHAAIGGCPRPDAGSTARGGPSSPPRR